MRKRNYLRIRRVLKVTKAYSHPDINPEIKSPSQIVSI
jgi:hypothetical protein